MKSISYILPFIGFVLLDLTAYNMEIRKITVGEYPEIKKAHDVKKIVKNKSKVNSIYYSHLIYKNTYNDFLGVFIVLLSSYCIGLLLLIFTCYSLSNILVQNAFFLIILFNLISSWEKKKNWLHYVKSNQ